jgi:hypothetical protein
VGAGALPLSPPSESVIYDTDKEKSLHAPRNPTWISIAEECAEEGVGVSMFLAPNKYMDTGSVAVVANLTGGEIFWHPRFVADRDAALVQAQLARLVGRMQGFNCMVRVRCSQGKPPFFWKTNPLHSFFLQVFKLKSITAHSRSRLQLNSHSRNCRQTAPSQSNWSTHAHCRHGPMPICSVRRCIPVSAGRGESGSSTLQSTSLNSRAACSNMRIWILW